MASKVRSQFAHMNHVMFEKKGRSKWERIGRPAFYAFSDHMILFNPYTPPKTRVMFGAKVLEGWYQVATGDSYA